MVEIQLQSSGLRGMGLLKTYLSDDPAEGQRGVGAGEDVLVHATV